MTMLEVLEKTHPNFVKQWDHWDFEIKGPSLLDDAPIVIVILKCKDGTNHILSIPIGRPY